jgi:hypothetical protein
MRMSVAGVIALCTCVQSLMACAVKYPSSGGVPFARPDAERMRLGEFEYSNSSGGKKVGDSTITIRLVDGLRRRYEFAAIARFSTGFSGFGSQHWMCVTTPTLEPILATLTFGDSTHAPTFEISYASGRVTGFVRNRKGPDAGVRRSVSAALPSGTFDQRVDWATVLASDLEPGTRFQFNVYDPSIGLSRAKGQVSAARWVRVPAGSFDVYPVVYEIVKSSGTERYEVFVTRETPRMIIREDFQNGVRGQLVRIEP